MSHLITEKDMEDFIWNACLLPNSERLLRIILRSHTVIQDNVKWKTICDQSDWEHYSIEGVHDSEYFHTIAMKLLGYGDLLCVNFFKLSANMENAVACYNLGYMFEKGLGVSKNLKAAIFWYEKATALDDPFAKRRLFILRSCK